MRTSPVLAVVFAVVAAGAAQASVKIAAGHTAHMTCADGVCAPTAKNAILNATDLANMLAASDVKVTTGSGAVTISVEATFSWTSVHRLTLDANTNVIFKAPVEVTGTGAVTIIVNDGGTDGALSFIDTGMLDFWDTKSSLVLNGQVFKLVPDVKTLAAAIAAHPARNFALMKSFDASVDGTYAAPPVATAFDGKFDGLGHAIANLAITPSGRPMNLALFLSAGMHAVLRNLNLQSFQLVFEGHPVSAAMLVVDNSGEVSRVAVSGGLIRLHKGDGAGIAVHNYGRISNSHVDGTVIDSDRSAGGIVLTNDGLIAHCQSRADVGGGYAGSAGGIAEWNKGTIRLSYAAGGVGVLGGGRWGSSGNEEAGGIAAFNTGLIDRSFSVAGVDGGSSSEDGDGFSFTSYAGGLSGENDGTILNSYARGTVESSDPWDVDVFVGGAVGYSRDGSSISGSYSTATLDCTDCQDFIGGFASTVFGATSDYWDMNTSGKSNGCGEFDCSGVAGLTTAQLKSGLPAGFDPAIWAQDPAKNDGYPYLIDNPPPAN